METVVKAYAKINLTLDLTAVLPNKYHGIFTVMQSVGLYDNVTIKTGKEGLSLAMTEIPHSRRQGCFMKRQV